MDADGHCYPTQARLAADLGVSRETANRRVRALLAYRWRDKPLLTAEKRRDPVTKAWDSAVYTVQEAAGLMFGNGRRGGAM